MKKLIQLCAEFIQKRMWKTMQIFLENKWTITTLTYVIRI